VPAEPRILSLTPSPEDLPSASASTSASLPGAPPTKKLRTSLPKDEPFRNYYRNHGEDPFQSRPSPRPLPAPHRTLPPHLHPLPPVHLTAQGQRRRRDEPDAHRPRPRPGADRGWRSPQERALAVGTMRRFTKSQRGPAQCQDAPK
jgi:hypothetical protein